MRRTLHGGALLTALASFAVLGWTPAAVAHNGVGAAFKGRAGPYTVYAYDGSTLPHDGLQYRLVLLDASSGEPADDIRVAVSASKPGTTRVTTTADVYANVVFYTLPNPYPANWLVHLRLNGHLGPAEVTFHMHGYPGSAATPPTDAAATTPATPTRRRRTDRDDRRRFPRSSRRRGRLDLYVAAASCRPPSPTLSIARRSSRARATLDRIVPVGQPHVSAASS